MGKAGLVRSLHQTLSNLKPTSPSCLCVQQPKTLSFRFTHDVYTRFNSIFLNDDDRHKEEEEDGDDDQKDDTEKHKLLLFPFRSHLDSCSFHSSGEPSSSYADSSADPAVIDEPPVRGLSSSRLFFSPCTTNSILEEGKRDQTAEVSGNGADATGLDEVMKRKEVDQLLDLCQESVTVTMNSDDPYRDFRTSMEEMMEAHCLKEWPRLQALLQCYLQLNDKQTHRIIVRAFIDLIMNIFDDTKD